MSTTEPMESDQSPADPAAPATAASTEAASAEAESAGATDISELRKEIDWLDAEILRLVKRRTEVSRIIGRTRLAAGGTRIVVNREMDVLARYRELGEEGRQLAMVLLNLGRGRLGRS